MQSHPSDKYIVHILNVYKLFLKILKKTLKIVTIGKKKQTRSHILQPGITRQKTTQT